MKSINIETIKQIIQTNQLRWTNHIMMRILQRNINQDDILLSLINGEIIEQYEEDYPYPSCLVYGKDSNNTILHTVIGIDSENNLWLITAYYPNDIEWEKDKKTRRSK